MKMLWLTVAPLDVPGFRATQFGMAIALERLGWKVNLMGKTDRNNRFEGFAGFGGKVTLVQRQGRLATELNYHLALWQRLKQEQFDVVMFEPPQLRWVTLPAILSRLGIVKPRFVLDVRTPLLDEGLDSYIERFNYWLAMKFAKWCLPGISVITEALKDDLQPWFGRKIPVAVWGSGVDAGLFNPARTVPVSRRSLGIRQDFVFLYHGTLSLARGLPELISAMKILHPERPEVALVLLGDGAARDALREQTRQSGLEGVVFFLDNVANAEVPRYIAMADAGVVPLPDERCWQVSSPIKLFEYMAMQMPLVVSDIEAHRAVLGGAPFAVYAGEVNPECLCQALKSCIDHAAELKKNARLAREMALAGYTWDKQAERLSAFLSTLSPRGEGRDEGVKVSFPR